MDTTLLTRSQVATRLGLSPERVRQLTVAGRISCRSTPLGRLYEASAIEAFAASRHPLEPSPEPGHV